MKKNTTRYRVGLLIILLGLGFVLYPLTSIVLNHRMAAQRMESFQERENAIPHEEIARRKEVAHAYNDSLDGNADGAVDPFDVKNYATVNPLDYEDGEVFGYLIVPKTDEMLPIYLGASEYHLSLGTGHVDGTDLPVGGIGTRSVIAGHRGFTTRAMFRNLEKMEPGDRFTVHALGDILEYEVYDTEVIQPSEYQKLAAVPGQDTLTLLTCTPYMVNTERLLVNAKRVNAPEKVAETPETNEPAEEPMPATETTETTEAATETAEEGPDRRVLLQSYGLLAVVFVLWVALLFVAWKLVRSFLHEGNKKRSHGND